MKTLTTYELALAFAKVDPLAGQDCKACTGQPAADRAANMVRMGYVKAGDPGEWGSGSAVATIYSEPMGGEGDCQPPADYHGRWPVIQLAGLWWEWQNCAVGLVFTTNQPVTVTDASSPALDDSHSLTAAQQAQGIANFYARGC